MILPLLLIIILGITAFDTFNDPSKFVSIILDKSEYVSLCNNLVLAMPALLIKPYRLKSDNCLLTLISSVISSS